MRILARLVVTGACAALVLSQTACAAARRSPAGAVASPRPSVVGPTRWPAAAAGGACQLLDYTVVEQLLGLAFEVAASGQQDATYTCVLQRTGLSVPDLSLAVTATTADAAVFRTAVVPKGSAALTGLGKAGYRSVLPPAPTAKRGPGVEVGWLSGNNRILVLRATLAVDAPPTAADELAPRLAELAKKVDQTSV